MSDFCFDNARNVPVIEPEYSMNEPHDVPNINTWAASVQAAVTAIRQAGYVLMIRLFPKKRLSYIISVLNKCNVANDPPARE